MSSQFQPKDPEYKARVGASFDEQTVMRLIGASLGSVEPGLVEIELPYRADLTQQDDFLHAGISSTIMDSACGYAAFR
jgi:acyl-coenzyme A thioesterase PaaI-like protein